MSEAWLHRLARYWPVPAQAHILTSRIDVGLFARVARRPKSHMLPDTNYLMNTHEGSSAPRCRTNPIPSEMTRLLQDLPTSISSKRSVALPSILCSANKPNRAILSQLRVLWQMTQLVMMKPEHIRPNMEEQKNDEQTAWVCLLNAHRMS